MAKALEWLFNTWVHDVTIDRVDMFGEGYGRKFRDGRRTTPFYNQILSPAECPFQMWNIFKGSSK